MRFCSEPGILKGSFTLRSLSLSGIQRRQPVPVVEKRCSRNRLFLANILFRPQLPYPIPIRFQILLEMKQFPDAAKQAVRLLRYALPGAALENGEGEWARENKLIHFNIIKPMPNIQDCYYVYVVFAIFFYFSSRPGFLF